MRLKRLELAWKRVWIRGITTLMDRGARGEAPDWGARPHRVLFLRHDRIGDMILSTGVIRAIATSHPTLTLDVLASPANAPILRAEPHVGEVVVFRRGKLGAYRELIARLRRARYDAVVDCMVTAPSLTTLLLMVASGARHRIGVGGRGPDIDRVITLPVRGRPVGSHMVEHLATLTTPFGVDPERADLGPTITLTDAERAEAERAWAEAGGAPGVPRLLLNVSAGKEKRLWPDDRFVAVLRHLRERWPGFVVLVIGAPAEAERMRAIAEAGGARPVPTPGVRQALALVAAADYVFTPDTSIAHAASAFRRPAVVLYLRGVAAGWRLWGTPGICLESPDATLASLALEPAIEALDRLLTEEDSEKRKVQSEE